MLEAQIVAGFVKDRAIPRLVEERLRHRVGRAAVAHRVDEVRPSSLRVERDVGRNQNTGSKFFTRARIEERLGVGAETSAVFGDPAQDIVANVVGIPIGVVRLFANLDRVADADLQERVVPLQNGVANRRPVLFRNRVA